MASDYQHPHRTHQSRYQYSQDTGSGGWLIAFAIAALLALVGFFVFAGTQTNVPTGAATQPAPTATTEQAPAPAAPAQ